MQGGSSAIESASLFRRCPSAWAIAALTIETGAGDHEGAPSKAALAMGNSGGVVDAAAIPEASDGLPYVERSSADVVSSLYRAQEPQTSSEALSSSSSRKSETRVAAGIPGHHLSIVDSDGVGGDGGIGNDDGEGRSTIPPRKTMPVEPIQSK